MGINMIGVVIIVQEDGLGGVEELTGSQDFRMTIIKKNIISRMGICRQL
jgi:hypothetical protein